MKLFATEVNAIGNRGVILDDVESELSFIIVSPQQLKPVISILAWLPLVTLPSTISRNIVDGYSIRAPPSKS